MNTWSIPGKTFVAGEYLALEGMPAILIAHGPRYRLRGARSHEMPSAWHPESPVELLRRAAHPNAASSDFFEDPFEGRGGFGGSTAQFALVWAAGQSSSETPAERAFGCWKNYRELSERSAAPGTRLPSGADLAAQIQGGMTQVRWDDGFAISDLSAALETFHFVIFSAARKHGRKVRTHEHLAEIAAREDLRKGSPLLAQLERTLENLCSALRGRNPSEAGTAMTRYAELLAAAGLEHPEATAERHVLSAVPGVLGFKGAGALLADAAVALVDTRDPESAAVNFRALAAAAESQGLAIVVERARPEAGLRRDE